MRLSFSCEWTYVQCPNIIHHYLAEYGSGVNVSTLGDVYSFGIMLLELCTGRRPTDEIFKDGLNIHQYVKSHLPRRVTEIADASLLLAYEEHNIYEDNASDLEEKAILQDDEYISKLNTSAIIQECLISIMKIWLLCSSSSPRDRMPISIALKEIHTIKNLFLETKRINNSIDRSDGNKLIKLSSSEFYWWRQIYIELQLWNRYYLQLVL